ncbi:succinate dehydrogenase subunit C [Longilinea arvoryzae]|uniref:Succinate dehydrogenase subunit C n=2 Tax=Longilinea arvoryzae TaxID=360412 RepID=A0A0S7BAI8_9CHLR|nr:succinate dehydrogenase subunit C [Longilinea arvoryzae]
MMKNESNSENLIRWFDPRSRKVGTWAFILNRITALGLTLYLFMHLIVLGNLARGPEAYDSFIAFAKNPVFIFGEMLVIAAGLIHGLNGIRIALNSFGVGVRYQKQLFLGLMLVAVAGIAVFARSMVFGGH